MVLAEAEKTAVAEAATKAAAATERSRRKMFACCSGPVGAAAERAQARLVRA